MFKKNITRLFIAVLALGLILLANGIILAWTAPTSNPPNANVPAPLNVSATAQTKAGGLTISGVLNVGSNLDVDGTLNVGGGANYFITKLGDSFALQNNAGAKTVVVGQDGHVGIGIDTPNELFEISGINESANLRLNYDDSGDINAGERLGEIIFSGAPNNSPEVEGAKISAESRDTWQPPLSYETDMVFYVRQSGGSLRERMRIRGDGLVRVGNGLEVRTNDLEQSALLKIEVSNPNTTTYACETRDLEDYCGDQNGCTISVLLQHETDGSDQVRGVQEYIFMEQDSLSNDNRVGVYGSTRQAGGGDFVWITGMATRYTIFETPWANWFWALNYYHGACPGQVGNSAPHADPYWFTFMSNPLVSAIVVVYD